MSAPYFTKEIKQKLRAMGENEFTCKDEHRIYMTKSKRTGFSAIDHVWLKSVPCPEGKKREVVVVAFEITKDLDNLWYTKKMKGDITNLRLTNASLGVLVIPCIEKLKEQATKRKGGKKWLEGINDYIKALLRIAEPMKVDVWCYDHEKGFRYFLTA